MNAITIAISNLKKLTSRPAPVAAQCPVGTGPRPFDATALRSVAGGDGNSTGPHIHF